MQHRFFPANAHEGCVWVSAQQRLYFSTTKDLDQQQVDICYLDFGGFRLREPGGWQRMLTSEVPDPPVQTWLADVSMANGFCLSAAADALLVAEQGDLERPATISRYNLFDKGRTLLLDNHLGKPFNSPNKVLVSREGHLIFSDPDYGFRQGFRPPPQLEPSLYIRPKNGELYAYPDLFEMPHGITLSPDEQYLFVTDTSADDGSGDEPDPDKRKGVFRLDFDPDTGLIGSDPVSCFRTDAGVPDGSITARDHLLVCGGDGIYVADGEGDLLGKIELERTAVNLCAAGPEDRHLFVTADEGVYFIFDWGEQVVTQ